MVIDNSFSQPPLAVLPLGALMSLIEIMRVLYDDIAVYEPRNPLRPTRDRIILSKGHGCLAQYALLADKGFFAIEALDNFCRHEVVGKVTAADDGTITGVEFLPQLGGHPDPKVPGIEATTGALGHGLAIGVGMALALRSTYVFEGMRGVLFSGVFRSDYFFTALMLDTFYVAMGAAAFFVAFHNARRRGALLQMGE